MPSNKRADSSYIPGGVVSVTVLIRPDFPELKDFGFLWQQMEYVLGGGSDNFMFLTLAADDVLNGHQQSFPPLAPPPTNQPSCEPWRSILAGMVLHADRSK